MQQDVEDVRVRLFDLVEQHHAVRLAAHSLGELAALVIADVSRRGTNETRDGEFLHVLGHVDAHEVVFIIEQAVGEGLCKLRLADARGAEEEEAADRAVRVCNAGARALDGLGHEAHGLVLTDDALVNDLVEAQQLFALALHQAADGDARPLAHDVGDLVLGHGVVHHGVLTRVLFGCGLGVLELLFEGREVRVLELCGLFVLEVCLRALDLAVHLLNLGL